jgi:hypothetical protein
LKNIIFLVMALGLAFGATIPKLYKMCQIKGWVSGATASQQLITQKWETPADNPRGRLTYWIAWSDVDIRQVGDHRLNVTSAKWNQLAVGDAIEVIRIPGDRWPYVRDGIFVSPDNFAFDGILLALELGVAVWMIVRLLQYRRQFSGVS